MNMLLIAGVAIAASLLLTTIADADDPPDPKRVRELAAMLPAEPVGVGRPISDRAAWAALAEAGSFDAVVREAEALLDEPIPDQPDELYLEFSRTGNRTKFQDVMRARRGRLAPLVIAECLEDGGRFVPAIEEIVRAVCVEPTWVLPSHDRELTNFRGEKISIDLVSSALGWHLSTVDWLLGERLDPEVRDLLRDKVRERVLNPYRRMFTGEEPANRWTRGTNNWNAVCLAGVTGAGLALLPGPGERAEFVAAAERYSLSFLSGFTPDGYCSEGLLYWNYGFGHYVLLSEIIRQATDGEVDLLARPAERSPATFCGRIDFIGCFFPAFADCSVISIPNPWTMYFINRVFGLGLDRYDDLLAGDIPLPVDQAMLFAFPNAASQIEPAADASAGLGLRDWFGDAGILIGRPAPDADCGLGVALKGGHNAEHHNHNDVGSYVVATGGRAVLLDPGAEVYTARTFGSRRYESKVLNSFGHPVPVVAGELQRTGADARAEVLASDFTDEADTLSLDITAAYDVPELEELTRTFVYSRAGGGALTVTDSVKFAEAASFETALVSRGEWTTLDSGDLLIRDHGGAVQVRVTVEGADFEIVAEEIDEDTTADAQLTRLAIRLTEPVTEATVEMLITPRG